MKVPTLPDNFAIKTRRLILRRFVATDWRGVHRYMSDPQVVTFLPGGVLTPVKARGFVARNAKNPHAIAVIEKASNELIGHMPFHPWFGAHTYEVGWAFGRDRQGQGYGTEAARALVDYAFDTLNCHRVIATCQPENPASWRIAEKLHMRREAHFKAGLLQPDGTWWDEYFYAILADEWRARKDA